MLNRIKLVTVSGVKRWTEKRSLMDVVQINPWWHSHLPPLPLSPCRCLLLPVSVLPAWLVSQEERNPLLPLQQTGTGAEEARPLGSSPRQGGACGDSHSRTPTGAGCNTFWESKFATTYTLIQNPPSLYPAKLRLENVFKNFRGFSETLSQTCKYDYYDF